VLSSPTEEENKIVEILQDKLSANTVYVEDMSGQWVYIVNSFENQETQAVKSNPWNRKYMNFSPFSNWILNPKDH